MESELYPRCVPKPRHAPYANVTMDEAFSLFGIGVSAITQVMQAIDTQPHASRRFQHDGGNVSRRPMDAT